MDQVWGHYHNEGLAHFASIKAAALSSLQLLQYPTEFLNRLGENVSDFFAPPPMLKTDMNKWEGNLEKSNNSSNSSSASTKKTNLMQNAKDFVGTAVASRRPLGMMSSMRRIPLGTYVRPYTFSTFHGFLIYSFFRLIFGWLLEADRCVLARMRRSSLEKMKWWKCRCSQLTSHCNRK